MIGWVLTFEFDFVKFTHKRIRPVEVTYCILLVMVCVRLPHG
jgi:hypothetical protein